MSDDKRSLIETQNAANDLDKNYEFQLIQNLTDLLILCVNYKEVEP